MVGEKLRQGASDSFQVRAMAFYASEIVILRWIRGDIVQLLSALNVINIDHITA